MLAVRVYAQFKVGDQREDKPFNNCIPQYDRGTNRQSK